jgi:hypothetical protein
MIVARQRRGTSQNDLVVREQYHKHDAGKRDDDNRDTPDRQQIVWFDVAMHLSPP